MDSDSFLEFLSPGFNDFDLAWGPADGSTCPPATWLPDGFINSEALVPENTEEEADEAESEGPPIVTSSSSCNLPSSTVSGAILSESSETYSSVLKLSDIASALHNFSMSTGLLSTPCLPPSTPLQRPSLEQIAANRPLSASAPESSCALHSPLRTAFPVDTSLMQSHFTGAIPESPVKAETCDNVHIGEVMSQLASQTDTFNLQGIDSPMDIEKESSSKLSSDGGSRWDASDNECNEDDDRCEDANPCVPHVRIIRRPNSNCGQALASSPKRRKLDHVKTEVTSPSETAIVQDDKDGESSLQRMRKEGMSQREVHILSERQRRKSMRESFSILQSLVPKLKIKHADRITVLTEVTTYIQSLRGTLEDLERKKVDIMDLLGLTSKVTPDGPQVGVQGTVTYVNTNDDVNSDDKIGNRSGGWCSLQNGERVAMVEVTVRICGADVFVTLSTPQCRGVWSGVLLLLQKYSIEVSNATLATSGDSSFHCIHAKATDLSCMEGVDLQEELEGIIIKELRKPARKG